MFTIVAVAFLVVIYSIIFFFSASDGDTSGELSRGIAVNLVRGFDSFFFIEIPFINTPEGIELINGIVRKMAHFTEYGIIGVLEYGIALCWSRDLKKAALLITAIVAASAALDELHQLFVPGRYSSPKDVLIDTLGGITGIGIAYVIYRARHKKTG